MSGSLDLPKATSTPQFAAATGRSQWADAWARLQRNKAAVAAFWVLLSLTVLAILLPLVWPHKYETIYEDLVLLPPSLSPFHPLGTDAQGRDLAARLFVGLRVSLAVGIVASLVALIIGVVWGAVAGYFGGVLDTVMMRFVDVLYALPFIFVVILLMVTFGQNIILIFLAIGAVEWLTMARIVRGQTLSLKKREFVEAARALGAPALRIIATHIAPNLLGPVVVYLTLTIPTVILAESFLSFLGLGVQEPLTSLGTLLKHGAAEMEFAPWLLIAPSVVMIVTLACFNFIGDGLRDALDPKDR